MKVLPYLFLALALFVVVAYADEEEDKRREQEEMQRRMREYRGMHNCCIGNLRSYRTQHGGQDAPNYMVKAFYELCTKNYERYIDLGPY